MTLHTLPRLLAGAVFTASVAALASPAFSQGPRPRALILPCCKCVDGSTQKVNISTGAVPWQVTAPGGPTATAVAVPSQNIPGGWTNALAPAQWVSHPSGNPIGNYVFQMQFYVPRCIIPATVRLTGRSAADNKQIVLLDGVQLGFYQNASGLGFTTANIVSFNAPPPPLTAGIVHTLQVVVNNISGPSGLVLQGTLSITCPKEPQMGNPVDPDRLETAPQREEPEARNPQTS